MEDIEKLAETQHALVRRDQLLTLGYSVGQVDGLVSRRRLERAARSVYRIPGSVPTYRQLLLAKVWGAGVGATAARRAGASLWRLPGFGDGALDVLRARHGNGQQGRHETCLLPAHHLAVVDSIPVTSPALTLLHLCGSEHPKRAERAVNNAINMKLVTPASLGTVLAEMARQGRNGITVLRHIISEMTDDYVPPASELEALVIAVLEGAAITGFELQKVVGGTSAPAGRVDMVDMEHLIVIEADSERYHASWLNTIEDRRRDRILTAAGFHVSRVTWWELTTDHRPFVAEIRALQRFRASLPPDMKASTRKTGRAG